MSEPAEIESPQLPVAPRDLDDDVVTLGPHDFQRIGIEPKETRLEVIRRASNRAARSLARRQLNAPDAVTERQLSRIAVSTYRLLDPRQRQDKQSRAFVGRIRPGALYRAGRAEFASEKILIQNCSSSESSVSTHHVNEMSGGRRKKESGDGQPTSATEVRPTVAMTNRAETVCPGDRAPRRFLGRVRGRATHPALIVTIIFTLLLTAAAVWKWGQDLQSLPDRLTPFSSQVRNTW